MLEYAIANLQLYRAGIGSLLRGATVVHLHNPPDTLFGVGLLARLLGRDVVFDHHDLTPELFEAKFGDSRVARLLRRFEWLSFRSATLVIAANESHREVAKGRGEVAGERIVVVRNGPPAAAFRQVAEPRDGRLDRPRLLFLGCMESQDGVDRLPALLRILAERGGAAGGRADPRRRGLAAAAD